jgi:hypothetical protein
MFVTILAWIAIGLGIFWLPYQFPPHREDVTIASLSALIGFNNNVSIVALLAGVLLLTALRWRQKLRPQFLSPAGMPLKPLLVVCIIQTVITITLLIATNGRPPAAEAYYFLDRLYPLATGMVPYRDFEFLYGPLLLYLPFWTSKLLGAPLYPVYVLVFLAFQLIGLYMLWMMIGIAKAPVRTKIVAFYCLAAVTLPNLSLGLQYTLPRYLTAFCATLALAAFARANRSRPIRLAWVCILLSGIVFGLSPEMGLVFIPAALAVLIAQAREAGDRPISSVLAFLAGLGVLLLLLPAGMLAGVTSYSGGGGSFPVVPSVFLVLYVVTVLIAGPHLLLALRQSDSSALPFPPDVTLGWAVLAFAMVAGALNRADGGHVFFYGIGFFLFLLLGAGVSDASRRVYAGLFALVFCVLVTYTGFYIYFDELMLPLPKAILGDLHWKSLQDRIEYNRQTSAGLNQLDAELPSTGPLCVPFGEAGITSYLARRGALQSDYFIGLGNIYSRADVQKKIAGLSRCRGLVASIAEMAPQPHDADGLIDYLRGYFANLFFYPLNSNIDRRQLLTDFRDPVRDYCIRHFRLQTRLGPILGLYRPVSALGAN